MLLSGNFVNRIIQQIMSVDTIYINVCKIFILSCLINITYDTFEIKIKFADISKIFQNQNGR